MKKLVKELLIITLVLCFISSLCGCAMQSQESPENVYETKIKWAGLNHYCFAVEVDNYNGDVVQAGTYRFYPDLVTGLENGKIALVWDVYVSETLYDNINQLDESEYVGTIGGISKTEGIKTLLQGQYVYIKYNPVANNNPTGILVIEKIN